MTDPRVDKLADVLVNYSVAVQPGNKVLIQGDALAEPLLRAVYTRVLQAGGYPLMIPSLPGMDELFFRYASDEQLQHVAEPLKLIIETYDVSINIMGAENTKSLSNVDPAKMVLRSQAQAELMKIYMQRSAAGEFRWVVTLFPTNAHAQDAEMSLSEYEDFVYGACMPDLDDPVGYWQRFSAWQQNIVDWLKGKERVRVVGPETELQLSIAGRTFINSDGKHNMPSGEVFTGPVEDSVEGHVHFSYPAIHQGREVAGVRLWFENGKVVKATADKNEDFLLQTLDTDAGSRYVGEFAIGTNAGITQFTSQILFDEKINGSFHMAVGAGFPETGSKNVSAIHWDMICDLRSGGEIWVDDELLYKNGEFAVEF
ncbi:MAG: aminopeptidase [Chloroflexi bacterium]|nr:MAG: aminopeptidase [Chloroflexota bacterium]RLC81345.1 MAG: aminopeptidase [Chloroflexota bacterium]